MTKVRARVGQTAGIVRLVYGAEVLAALDELRSPLLARGGRDNVVEKLARYRTFCAGAATIYGQSFVNTLKTAASRNECVRLRFIKNTPTIVGMYNDDNGKYCV